MEILEVQNDLIKMIENIGEVVYGFAYVGDIVSEESKHLPYAISIGLPLTPSIVDNIIFGPNQPYYQEYLSVNHKLDLITNQIQAEIEKRGYRAHAIPSSQRTDPVKISGEFSHKAAAVKGGLGWIGRSSLLITRKYGPRIRLATVLTDIPLKTNTLLERNYCGKCKTCVDRCPTGAIVGNAWSVGMLRENLIDANKCDLWKIHNYPQFKGQICGICVAVCPHGKPAKPSI